MWFGCRRFPWDSIAADSPVNRPARCFTMLLLVVSSTPSRCNDAVINTKALLHRAIPRSFQKWPCHGLLCWNHLYHHLNAIWWTCAPVAISLVLPSNILPSVPDDSLLQCRISPRSRFWNTKAADPCCLHTSVGAGLLYWTLLQAGDFYNAARVCVASTSAERRLRCETAAVDDSTAD